jgi:beta-lactamase superfamily II metal-dependent hydrolase
MKVYCYNAGCGDAFRIEFTGSSGKTRHILLDSGFQSTFRTLLIAEIRSIELKKEAIDLCVITHIHDDHIGGIQTMINAIQAGRINDIISKWWFNPPRISNLQPKLQRLGSIAQSINQADVVASYLQSKDALPKSPIVSSTVPYELDGMEIYVLSPNKNNLHKLLDKYSDQKVKIERFEDEQVSRAIAKKSRDYDVPVEEFNFNGWKEDRNIENGSSVALLTKYKEKTVLWLADAFPSIVVASLESLGFSISNPVTCDYVKISHHGSLGNNSSKLYQMIKCQKYILSTDGYNSHGLPAKACLVQILNNPLRNDKFYSFYFTTNDPILNTIFEVDGEDVYKKLNFEMIFPIKKDGFIIEF